jgi:23S rRNA (guanine745-N1)-methyltransferase
VFRCPVCSDELRVDDRTYRCPGGHSFDRARDGSVNLLAGSSARHRPAGDSTEMVTARSAFLDAGHYDRLRDVVLREIETTATVLDIGCGDGHYTRPLASDDGVWRGGIDLSKPAIAAAARRTRGFAYAVAPAHALPIVDQSIAAAVIVFGPMVAAELTRVVTPGGTATVVVPGPRHLTELKRLLFARVDEHPAAPPSALASLAPPRVERVADEIALEHADLHRLWTMTPYRWQVERDRKIELPESATVTIDFLVCRYAFV